jgi:tetratricopeptide (TPR) repeat protein/predicted Ser/Thr protein kinase
MELLADSRIGPYRILDRLGAGGMGEVFLAEDTRLGRKVALKTVGQAHLGSAEARQRLLREARAAANLNHPNIAAIYDVLESGDRAHIVMEYVRGETLAAQVRRGPLEAGTVVRLGIQLAEALAAAHASGVIHRDLKPANVVATPDGQVKILDFGLAKIQSRPQTRSDTITKPTVSWLTPEGHGGMGTPPYMSPEQVLGRPCDERSDIYSLGVLLFELLTGRRPFTGTDTLALAMAILNDPRPKLRQLVQSAPAELEAVVLRAMAREPSDRYGSASEIARDLRRIETPTSARTLSAAVHAIVDRGWGSSGRRRGVLAAGALLVILAGAEMVHSVGWLGRGALPPVPAEAQRWYEQGTAALRDGAYLTARRRFEKAVQLHDAYPLAHARLAEARAELDDLDGAKDSLLYVQTLVPDLSRLPRTDVLNLEGIRATVGRRFDAAVHAFEGLAAATPGDPAVRLDLGRALEANGDMARAQASYEEAARLEPAAGAPPLRLGILHGHAQELEAALAAFAKAEEIYGAASNVEGLAEVAYQRGTLYNSLDRLKEARADLERALSLATDTGNTHQRIRALLQLSSVSVTEGALAEAERRAEEAVTLATGMDTLAASGLIDLGNTFFARGRNAEAERRFQQALEAARRYRARRTEARALLSLGSLRIQEDRVDDGVRYVEQALPFYQQRGFQKEASQAFMLLGRSYDDRGDFAKALRAYDSQLRLAREQGSSALEGSALDGTAFVLVRSERYPEALATFAQSEASYSRGGDALDVAYSRLATAEVLALLGRTAEARDVLERVTPLEGLRSWLGLTTANVALAQGNFAEARRELVQVRDGGTDDRRVHAETLCRLGTATAHGGSGAESLRLTSDALVKARELGDPVLTTSALLAHAEAALQAGRNGEALAAAGEAAPETARLALKASAWRAQAIAARAAERLGDQASKGAHRADATRALDVLEAAWGKSAVQGFLGRKDVSWLR